MKPEIMKEITQGAENVVYENGKFKFYRFTKEEMKTTENYNVLYAAGVCLEFKTDGSVLLLKVNARQEMGIRWYFSVDIYEDGKKLGHIKNFDEAQAVGNYAEKEYELGTFSGKFRLKDGEKCVRIVLPHSVITEIEEFEIENATYVIPVKREKTLIVYGDSITQGYDALFPSHTYAMRLADRLGAELFNKGLGGAPFLPQLVWAADAKAADFVTVAYGTNDWNSWSKEDFYKNVSDFFVALTQKYPKTPIFAITPIWRWDAETERPMGRFSVPHERITEICEKYDNITVISGISLVPGRTELFGDLRLHPNDDGFEHYFKNLAKKIRG